MPEPGRISTSKLENISELRAVEQDVQSVLVVTVAENS